MTTTTTTTTMMAPADSDVRIGAYWFCIDNGIAFDAPIPTALTGDGIDDESSKAQEVYAYLDDTPERLWPLLIGLAIYRGPSPMLYLGHDVEAGECYPVWIDAMDGTLWTYDPDFADGTLCRCYPSEIGAGLI